MTKQTTQSIKTNKSGKAVKATLSSRQAAGASIAVKPQTSATPSAVLPELMVLGIDVHLRQHVVCRKTDASTVQPAQPTGARVRGVG